MRKSFIFLPDYKFTTLKNEKGEIQFMKKTVFIVLVACMSVLSALTAALAADNLSAKYDLAQNSLSVSGSFGSANADLLTTVTVFKADSSIGDSELPELFQTVFTDDDGDIDLSVELPSSMLSDKYTVRVANEHGSNDIDFLFAKASDIKAVMLLLNDAVTLQDAEDIISSNYAKLALDSVAVAPYVSELAKAYIDICSDTNYTDERKFYPDFMQCLAAAEIKCGEDAQEVLSNYKLYIGSEVDKIKTYPEAVRTLLLQYVTGSAYNGGLLSSQLPKLRVLAFFKSSATSGAAKLNILGKDSSGKTYIDNFALLKPDCTYYNKVNNVNLVYEKIFSKRDSITSFDILKKEFEIASKNVYDAENKKETTSTKGGSTGSVPTANFTPGTQLETEQSNALFTDISGHWAKTQIELLADRGVISGYPDGSFKPSNNVTRAEFAKMITAFADSEASDGVMNFADVAESEWYYEYIYRAFCGGLVNGISETEFMPNRHISRQDVCVIISRYLGERLPVTSNLIFADSADVADYAADAVASLSSAGILNGYEDGSFKPQSSITRAETAVILSRIADYIK